MAGPGRSVTAEQLVELAQEVPLRFRDEFFETMRAVATGDVVEVKRRLRWREDPVPMEQFIVDPYFLGMKGQAYDEIVALCSEIDVSECEEVILTGGLGWGKSFASVILMARQAYLFNCLRDPWGEYEMTPGFPIVIIQQSVTRAKAKDVLFTGLAARLRNSPYFQECCLPDPKIESELKFPNGLVIKPVASGDAAAIGENCIAGTVDEVNFMRLVERSARSRDGQSYDQATESYRTLATRRRSRFVSYGKLPGWIVLVSSSRYPSDFTEQKMTEAKDDPRIFVRRYSNWATKRHKFQAEEFTFALPTATQRGRILDPGETTEQPTIQVPEDFREDFQKYPEQSTREIAGFPTEAITPFIARRELLADMVRPEYHHPFDVESGTMQDGIKLLVAHLHKTAQPRALHLDLSKNRDATGLVFGYVRKVGVFHRTSLESAAAEKAGRQIVTEETPDGRRYVEHAPIIVIEGMLRITAPPGDEVLIEEVLQLVFEIKRHVPLKWVTSDQFQSLQARQMCRARGLITGEVSVDTSVEPYMNTRMAIYDRRLETYHYPVLLRELAALERVDSGGKIMIDHPRWALDADGNRVAGCFAGDTRVRLLDGCGPTFHDLVKEYGDGRPFHVYTIRDGSVSVGVAHHPRWTKYAPVVEVELDNGQCIRCTPDHPFMLRNGTWSAAGDLEPGTSLMPLYTRVSEGRSRMNGYELYCDPRDERWHFTHRMVGRWKYPDHGYTGNQNGAGVIHHSKGKLNNDPDALIWFATQAEHRALHGREMLRYRANPEFEARRLVGLRAYNDDPVNRQAQGDRLRLTMGRPEVRAKRDAASAITGRRTGPENMRRYNQSAKHRLIAAEIGKRTIWHAIEARRRRDVTADEVPECRLRGMTNPQIAAALRCSISLVERRIGRLRAAGVVIPASPYLVRNHKVVAVRLAGLADVFDLTVDGTENFALASGVFVHNSKDVADGLAGVIHTLSMRRDSWRPSDAPGRRDDIHRKADIARR